MSFWTPSGPRMSEKRFCPYSPPDSMTRSPAPTTRSRTLWRNLTSLIRSRGISIEDLAGHPDRWMTRSEVTTKWAVIQDRNARAGKTRKATMPAMNSTQVSGVGGSNATNTMASAAISRTVASTGRTRAIQCGRMSSTSSSWSARSRFGKGMHITVAPGRGPEQGSVQVGDLSEGHRVAAAVLDHEPAVRVEARGPPLHHPPVGAPGPDPPADGVARPPVTSQRVGAEVRIDGVVRAPEGGEEPAQELLR